jgi:ABC-type bacteriocin/lantibiotic exporter with double-glycine peptidase domain
LHITTPDLQNKLGPVALVVDSGIGALPLPKRENRTDSLLALLISRLWRNIALLVFLGTVQAAIALSTPLAIGFLADTRRAELSAAASAVMFCLAFFAMSTIAWWRVQTTTLLSIRTERLLRSKALAHALAESTPSHSTSSVESSSTINGAIAQYRSFVAALLPTAISDAVWLIAIVSLLAGKNLRLAAVVIVSNAVVTGTLIAIRRRTSATEYTELVSQGTVSDVIERARAHQWQFAVSGAREFLGVRFRAASDALAQQSMGRGRYQALARVTVGAATWITPLASMLILLRDSSTAPTSGELIAVYGLTLQGLGQVAGFIELNRVWNEFDASSDLLGASDRAERASIDVEDHASTAPSRPLASVNSIEAEDLSFSYGREHQIVRHCSICVNAGEFVLLQGPSGIGKSTLIHLLSGALAPGGGFVHRKDPNGLVLTNEASCVGYVGPTSRLVSGSVRDNIALGRTLSESDLIEAVQRSGLTDVLALIAGGLAGTVGPNGQLLSSGQTQRVLLARCFATPARLMLIDEGFSALDETSESAILSSLRAAGKTVLLVSHRPSVRQHMDRVLTMRDGRVYE